jgi:hypothetical protein
MAKVEHPENKPAPHYAFGVREAWSIYDPYFAYRLGTVVEVSDCDLNPSVQCGRAIHFFLTQKQALDYGDVNCLPDNADELEKNFAGLAAGVRPTEIRQEHCAAAEAAAQPGATTTSAAPQPVSTPSGPIFDWDGEPDMSHAKEPRHVGKEPAKKSGGTQCRNESNNARHFDGCALGLTALLC